MRGAILPDALLATSLGLALGFTAPAVARISAGIMIASAVGIALIPMAGLVDDIVFAGCWLSIMAAAACVHLPGGLGRWPAFGLAINCGIWAGLVSHVSDGVTALAYALPAVLVVVPARIMVARKWGIAVKVAASWLIAIAALEVVLIFVPTPGYKPDHMD